MIQKMSDPGAGFRGALNYNLAARKQPELIGGNMAGETARELAREFGLGRALNRAVGKPVFHASLTAAPGDQLSEDDWRRFGTAYLDRLGYGECQQVLIRHRNTEHEHLHLVANRIDRQGRRVPDFQERRRGEAIVRDLEREFGITQVAPSRQAHRAAPGRAELGRFARTGEVAVKTRLQEHVDLAARGGPSLPELAERLRAQGVELRAHVAATGRLAGLSFELDGMRCKGSALGRGYSWLGLAGRAGVTYEPARDLARLRELGAVAARAPGGVSPEAKGAALAASTRPTVAEAASGGGEIGGAGAAVATRSDGGRRPAAAVGQLTMAEPPAAPATSTRTVMVAAADHGAAGGQAAGHSVASGQVAGLGVATDPGAGHGAFGGRVAGWADAPGGPAPAEVRRVPVYRAAAVLRSRVEIHGRSEALRAAIEEQATIVDQGGRLAAAQAREERARSEAAREALGRQVMEVYGRPDEAGRRLEELIARQGAAGAAAVVTASPESLGALRGVGVGGWQSAARRTARNAAGHLAAELRAMADRLEQAAAGEPARAAAAARVEASRDQVKRLARALGRLPHREQLERDLVRAAEVLGGRLTALLAPARLAGMIAGRVARAAAALARGRDDRSLGR